MPPRKPAKKKDRSRANGQGTVYKSRDKFRWQFVVPSQGDGKGIRLSGVELTREKADLKLATVRADYARGTLTTDQATLLRDYAEAYYQQPRGWSNQTKHRYAHEMKHAVEFLGHMKLKDIKPSDVKALIAHLSQKPSESIRSRGKTLSTPTIRHAVSFLRRILEEAHNDGLIPSNPAGKVRVTASKRLAVSERSERANPRAIFDRQQAAEFCSLGFTLYENDLCPAWPTLYLAIALGLRRGEIAGLRWRDFDAERGTLSIQQSRNTMRENTAPKTTTSRRDLYLPASVLTLINGLQRRGEPMFATETGGYIDPDVISSAMKHVVLWSHEEGRTMRLRGASARVSQDQIDRVMATVLAMSPLPRVNVHGLRHTYASLSLEQGVPVEVVSKSMGHSKVSMTYDTYRHVLEKEMRRQSIDLFAAHAPTAHLLHTTPMEDHKYASTGQ